MIGKMSVIAAVSLGSLLSGPSHAVEDTPFSATSRAEVVQTLAVKLRSNYIEPAVAERVANAIVKKNAEGGYGSATTAQAFTAALSKDLRELSDDKHFMAGHDERFRERSGRSDVPTSAEISAQRDQMARQAYGIEKIEHLPGNVGYIELRGFGHAEVVGPAYTAAMALVAGSDALILDLRRNSAGRPDSVAYLMSHFFPLGDERHLNDIYDRPSDTTKQYWTLASIAQRYDKPVYVLTSARTFSGGEECAYDFQTQKRGILVGETTGGGANPARAFSMGQGIVVSIPVARTINPVTKTSWQNVGVKPDIAVPAAQAQQTAHLAILRNLLSSAQDEQQRRRLQGILSMVERGETEKRVYTLRQ